MFDPKADARKLVEDFIPYVAEEDFHGNKVELYFAKQCASIAVERIIADYKSYRVKHYLTLESAITLCEYWDEVLIEIKEL
jgi:hypothetical protein